MNNCDMDARSRIIKTAIELLDEEKDINKITVRKIAERAGVGIGLINYHFKSKEKLLNEAVNETMAEMAEGLRKFSSSDMGSPLDKLKEMLKQLSEFAIKYRKLTQISVTFEILQGEMQVPLYLLPLLREIFGREKDEKELRLLAFTIINSLQVILLRADAFYKYSGIDILEKTQRSETIDMLIDNIIKK